MHGNGFEMMQALLPCKHSFPLCALCSTANTPAHDEFPLVQLVLAPRSLWCICFRHWSCVELASLCVGGREEKATERDGGSDEDTSHSAKSLRSPRVTCVELTYTHLLGFAFLICALTKTHFIDYIHLYKIDVAYVMYATHKLPSPTVTRIPSSGPETATAAYAPVWFCLVYIAFTLV